MAQPPEARGGARRPMRKGRLRARPGEGAAAPATSLPGGMAGAAATGPAEAHGPATGPAKAHGTATDPAEAAPRAPALAAPGGPSVPRFGWRVVAAKEFADHVMSARFMILILILGLAATGAVYQAASAINGITNKPANPPGLFLALFTAAPSQFPAFYFLIGFLGPLLGIAFGFDAVNGERAERTLPRLLAQPIYRDDVINGKFVAGLAAIGCILTAVMLLVAGIGLFELGIVPAPEDIMRMLIWLVVAIIYVGFWLAFAMLCSVAVRRAATSALIAIAVWLVLTLFATLLVGIVAGFFAPLPANATTDQQIANAQLQIDLSHVSPSQLFDDATAFLLDPTTQTVGIITSAQTDRAVASILPLEQSLLLGWPEGVALVALTVACFGLTYVTFLRQEVRA